MEKDDESEMFLEDITGGTDRSGCGTSGDLRRGIERGVRGLPTDHGITGGSVT